MSAGWKRITSSLQAYGGVTVCSLELDITECRVCLWLDQSCFRRSTAKITCLLFCFPDYFWARSKGTDVRCLVCHGDSQLTSEIASSVQSPTRCSWGFPQVGELGRCRHSALPLTAAGEACSHYEMFSRWTPFWPCQATPLSRSKGRSKNF